MEVAAREWWEVLARISGAVWRLSGVELSRAVNDAVGIVGMTAEVYLVDRAQGVLTPIGSMGYTPLGVDGTLAGRVFQLLQIEVAPGSENGGVLWVPILDSTDRVGVLRLGLPDHIDGRDVDVRQRCSVLGNFLGHVLVTKFAYGDSLQLAVRSAPLTPAAELLWQLLPPLTVTTKDVVISAVLHPADRVAGDAFDYSVDQDRVFVALFDAVGHDLQSGLTTAIALAGIRNVRRGGERCLTELARRADMLLMENRGGDHRFVTAVLAWLDTDTGVLTYLVAGSPPPILLRANKTVKTLTNGPRVPLGVRDGPVVSPDQEQLEPGDRLLLYTDGITEARDQAGEFFGTRRLIEFAERSSAAGLSAPETLRRLAHNHLDHQGGRVQDDATLLMLDWRPSGTVGVPLTPEQQARR